MLVHRSLLDFCLHVDDAMCNACFTSFPTRLSLFPLNSEQRNGSPKKNGYENEQKFNSNGMKFGGSMVNGDDEGNFDPDERQVRALLKQNLKYFDANGTIDFEKLSRELKLADRNQSGVLNRQQIEEVVYKVRLPLQRSLIFQILERHCRAYSRLYK